MMKRVKVDRDSTYSTFSSLRTNRMETQGESQERVYHSHHHQQQGFVPRNPHIVLGLGGSLQKQYPLPCSLGSNTPSIYIMHFSKVICIFQAFCIVVFNFLLRIQNMSNKKLIFYFYVQIRKTIYQSPIEVLMSLRMNVSVSVCACILVAGHT